MRRIKNRNEIEVRMCALENDVLRCSRLTPKFLSSLAREPHHQFIGGALSLASKMADGEALAAIIRANMVGFKVRHD